jgi:hypothetical protein
MKGEKHEKLEVALGIWLGQSFERLGWYLNLVHGM